MKYIRTKDGRIRELNFDYRTGAFTGNGYYRYKATSTEQDGLVHKNYVIKQGDAIEELCDEFVVVQKDFHDSLNANTHCLQTLKRYYEINKIEVLGIYGAIWTDKGLIYVAKMNDKGELELL